MHFRETLPSRRGRGIVCALGSLALLACGCTSQQASGATVSSTSTTAAANSLPAASAVFPANIYPLPTKTTGKGTNAACPSMEGVQSGVPPSKKTLVNILNEFTSASSAQSAKLLADRAAWGYIAPSGSSQENSPPLAPNQTYLVSPGQLAKAPQPVTASCSKQVMQASWFLEMCATGGSFGTCNQAHPALVGVAGFVNRNSHWLIWFLD